MTKMLNEVTSGREVTGLTFEFPPLDSWFFPTQDAELICEEINYYEWAVLDIGKTHEPHKCNGLRNGAACSFCEKHYNAPMFGCGIKILGHKIANETKPTKRFANGFNPGALNG